MGFLGFGGERVTAAEREFIDQVKRAFDSPAATPSRLLRTQVIITAGPTHEPIDADHFIGTHDGGLLGYKLAEAAVNLGSETVLVSGPAHLPLPPGAQLMPVTTTIEMLSVCERELPCDIAICAAAVSKWRLNPGESASNPLQVAAGKQLSLVATPDIVKVLATHRDRRPTVVVGCATERTTQSKTAARSSAKRNAISSLSRMQAPRRRICSATGLRSILSAATKSRRGHAWTRARSREG